MKKRFFRLLFAWRVLFLGVVLFNLSSCEDRETNLPWWGTARIEAAEDFKNNLSVEVYDMTLKKEEAIKENKNDSVKKVFKVSSSNNICFYLSVQKSGAYFTINHDDEELDAYWRFVKAKERNIENKKPLEGQAYIYAGIGEGCSITADKPLFEVKEGGNLSDYFKVNLSAEQMIAASYPEFEVVHNYYNEPQGVLFNTYFLKGTALSSYPYMLTFTTVPKEQYDEIVFSFEIPIEFEYMQQIIYGKDYPEEYYEQGLVERNENRVLRGSVTVRFED